MSDLVSILIPCRNASAWLSETLDSALAQSWREKEVIVVDDGSTDESVTVARAFESRGVRVIAQPNRGASAARNTAIAAATGDWLQFVDADDLLAPDKIAQQMALADRVGPSFAICGHWSRFTTRIGDRESTPEPLCADAPPVEWMITKLDQHRMMHPAAWLISRTLADRAGPWDESLSLDDDGEYFTRVVLNAVGVRCCRAAFSYYRSGIRGSLSGRTSERALASAFQSVRLSTEHLLHVENSARVRGACATALQRFIFEAYPRARRCRRDAARLVAEYGGSALRPGGGPRFQMARRWLGWKLARRIEVLARRR